MIRRSLRQSLVPLFVLACLLLGGSPQGVWRNLALQLAAIAMIAWALLSSRRTVPTPGGRFLLLLSGLWFLLVLLQLVPLPPGLWSALPGRAPVAEAFTLRGQPLPWLPLSLAPAATASILPIMAVPLAILAAMLWLGAYRSRWCVFALMVGTFGSVVLGALQLTSGGPYLYPIYNTGAATGLFANANHQGSLLLVTMPFLAAIIGGEQKKRGRIGTEALSRLLISVGGLAVVLLGLALNGSTAALLLAVPVGLACFAVAVPGVWRKRRLVGAVAGLLLLAGAAGLGIFGKAGSESTSVTTRADIYQKTAAAIGDSFPAGTGLGSFESYYRMYEDPAAVDRYFVNHAHSDPLEWVLETGLPGTLLLVAFLLWWFRRSWKIWRAEQKDLMALAGTIGSAALLAHSLVDYPLRDAALQALFALCLAFMCDPRSHAQAKSEPRRGRSARHLSLEDDVAVSG
ncbi:hypothetical protein GCM10022280_16290 [Sphingomonas swuensis]|uniref:O-antigen ligase-related domain-containing protein n=1 Tax=Sphingomonas swuensis TaxID=977800 RepID=A0ABP7SXE7_9SPHN